MLYTQLLLHHNSVCSSFYAVIGAHLPSLIGYESVLAGSAGHQVKLQANYFPLLSKTDWCLYQYRVDFDPSIDMTPERRRLLRGIRERLAHSYLFDGTVMFCSYRLDPDVSIELIYSL